MIGIQAIGTYLPKERISNLERMTQFESDEDFVRNKIGIVEVSVKDANEDTSDLAVKAFADLTASHDVNLEEIEVCILVTQNPDSNIPHSSSLVHKKIGLPESCACFDISLGCSGFVYGLSVIEGFMESNGFTKGLLFTSDPYSKIIDQNDKNTSFLFGDGATATYLTDSPVFVSGKYNFGTIGAEGHNLQTENEVLFMNGRSIFNFAARYVPKDVQSILKKNNLNQEDIDQVVFHQGSKYIIDTLIRRTKFKEEIVVNDITHYGNTVSSSIPMILKKIMNSPELKNILICGFGVGLSWASTILKRK